MVQTKTVRRSVRPGGVRFGKPKGRKTKQHVVDKPTFVDKPIGGEKNGGTRKVRVKKLPAYYASQPNPKKRAKRVKRNTKALRSSLTPGTVCILLAGVHKGKKVVFLKQLRSGLCLVTGPFKINACPLRRINQIFLIATATKLDMGKLGVPKHIDDKYFRRIKAKRPKKEEGDIFEQKQEKYVPTAQRKTDQKVVDGMVMSVIRKRGDKKMLFGYLGTPFGLRNKMYPHRLKF
ncbi:60S ribosomal protein L6 [Chionoecetes opilio]|uniref:Large ribosomal subunit protein eL6 n=1 Tax=Chionoecetes opilio TaxID=41210 RepID=A0A8J4YSW6_CHIOP|nr:60S ribosomal protein L6 [Chionoecetes opilio]